MASGRSAEDGLFDRVMQGAAAIGGTCADAELIPKAFAAAVSDLSTALYGAAAPFSALAQ